MHVIYNNYACFYSCITKLATKIRGKDNIKSIDVNDGVQQANSLFC